MFTKLIMHIFLNNININKYMHIFYISIVKGVSHQLERNY